MGVGAGRCAWAGGGELGGARWFFLASGSFFGVRVLARRSLVDMCNVLCCSVIDVRGVVHVRAHGAAPVMFFQIYHSIWWRACTYVFVVLEK